MNSFIYELKENFMSPTFKKLTFLVAITGALLLSGCSSKKKRNSNNTQTEVSGVDERVNSNNDIKLNGDSDSLTAGSLSTIYFAYNSHTLSRKVKDSLKSGSEFLKGDSKLEVQIEGHCDERGGIQYNLALGEKRAKTIKNYMVAMGVASRRITIISYGKERPLEFGHSEGAWSRNRRGNFVITAK